MGRLDLPDPRRDEDSADAPLRAVSESGDDRAAAEFEYGVLWSTLSEIHRSGMTEEEARSWVAETESLGARHGAFLVIRRPIGAWEIAA